MSANKIMILATIAIICLLLTSCGGDDRVLPVRTVEVAAPVLEIRPVPEELKRQPIPPAALPLWVLPTDPKATSCLTPEGEARRRMLDADFVGKLDAWEKWGLSL